MIPNRKYWSKRFTFLWRVPSWLKKLFRQILSNEVIKVSSRFISMFFQSLNRSLLFSVPVCLVNCIIVVILIPFLLILDKFSQFFLLVPVLFILNVFFCKVSSHSWPISCHCSFFVQWPLYVFKNRSANYLNYLGKVFSRHCVKSVQIRSYFWSVDTAWKVSKYGVIFSPYLDTFHALRICQNWICILQILQTYHETTLWDLNDSPTTFVVLVLRLHFFFCFSVDQIRLILDRLKAFV